MATNGVVVFLKAGPVVLGADSLTDTVFNLIAAFIRQAIPSATRKGVFPVEGGQGMQASPSSQADDEGLYAHCFFMDDVLI